MSGPDALLAAAITVGVWLGILVRAVLWVVLAVLALAGFVLLAIWGMTVLGRQVEYRTRPE